ncbi:MAG: oligoribonuclease, partial [Candidatus Bipolaricaulis sp.]|nr:oligoribonuclease [Candidatus Bipolaricaulis sp.]
MARSSDNLIWIDLEATGLDPETRVILEIACLVTDRDLSELGDGVDLVIHQEGRAIGQLDPWCRKQHGVSGLLEASRTSAISLADAEAETLAYVRRHCLVGKSP